MYCFTCMNEMKINRGEFCPHCGHPLKTQTASHHLAPGTILNAKYLIGNFIGEGGFGITYIGKDLNLDVRIAVKEYYPRGLVNRSSDHANTVSVSSSRPGGADFFKKGKWNFLQEARSIAKFPEVQGIVNVRDFFEENSTAYIVMEYLEGENLKKHIQKSGRMEPSECIRLMLPVMASLEKFHQAGMIHRDISPDNIMFMKNGTLKLMDFGSARYFTNQRKEMSIILKQGYSPEEQYRKNGVQGPWTDIYSLCATIYTCITGVKPENALDRLHQDALKRPSQLGVPIRPEQENVLMKGLAVSPEDRWKSVQQLMDMILSAPRPVPSKNRFPAVISAAVAAVCICTLLIVVTVNLLLSDTKDPVLTVDSQEIEEKAENEKSVQTAGAVDIKPKNGDVKSVKTTKKISVPDVAGLRLSDAKKKLKAAGLEADVIYTESRTVERDYVISQSPAAEKKVKNKTVVTIYVSDSDLTQMTAAKTQAPIPTAVPVPTAVQTPAPETLVPAQPESSEKNLYCCASEYATLRSEPSRSGAELARVYSREEVQCLGLTGEFYNVVYKGQNGYVLRDFFSEDPNASLNYGNGSVTASDSALIYYCCASEYVTLRAEASRDSAEIGRVASREAVQYISSAGEFFYVSHNGKSGYVLKNYFSEDPNASLNYGRN